MGTNNLQIIYSAENNDREKVHWVWESEAKAMQAVGMSVALIPNTESRMLLFRGNRSDIYEYYKKDNRYINEYRHVIEYSRMSHYFQNIADISIETFFVDDLNDKTIELIKKRGWQKAFIKKDVKSLEHIDDGKSIWPKTSLEEMNRLYNEFQEDGKFAIRKFIEKEIFCQEERYWVMNGNLYHRHNKIPELVKEAAKRLNKLGSRYYTIDATPEFVVEVNPGESSDRHAVNSAELFASWIKKEFAT
ncbi:MAG: ATP-grasp domain-containing protein [Bacteroidales bacterium]